MSFNPSAQRLEDLRAEGEELRRCSRAMATVLEQVERELDRVTALILRREFRLRVEADKKRGEHD